VWEDLSAQVGEMPVSGEDKALLDQRLDKLTKGEAEVLDWDSVKGSIGRK